MNFLQGRFEILSLTGSFMPSDNAVAKSRSGGMSVSLAGPDGRVLGGGLAGMLLAAGPVQVSKIFLEMKLSVITCPTLFQLEKIKHYEFSNENHPKLLTEGSQIKY